LYTKKHNTLTDSLTTLHDELN